MITYIKAFFVALVATSVSLVGDVYINEAAQMAGRKSVGYLLWGSFIFGLSGLLWYFVFKKLSFSGVVLLYLFLSAILAVGIDYVKYGNIPDIKAWIGLALFCGAMWLMRDYMAGH